MRDRFVITVFAFGLAVLCAPTSGQGFSVELPLVQAYARCDDPNAVHTDPPAAAACAPAVSSSGFRVPPTESTIRLTTGGTTLRITVQLRAVARADGTLYSGEELSARAVIRLTDGQCASGGDCTVEDTAVAVPVRCKLGKCSAPSRPIKVPRRRSALELVRVEIVDDQGNVVAVPGLWP